MGFKNAALLVFGCLLVLSASRASVVKRDLNRFLPEFGFGGNIGIPLPGCDNCVDDSNAECIGTIDGGHECKCLDGYGYEGDDARECTDIDECTDGGHTCHVNAKCENTVGSFSCECKDGFAGDGVSCQDIDECTEGFENGGNRLCARGREKCVNTQGAYRCDCKEGLERTDKDKCKRINRGKGGKGRKGR